MLAPPRPEAVAVTPTQTAPDPAVFSPEVLAFAAERGVAEYLAPLYELAKQCFDRAEVRILHERDPEIPNLQWIVLEVASADWPPERYQQAHARWLAGFHQTCPASARASFVLGD